MIEENLLGGLIMEPAMLDDIRGGAELFADPDRRLIFEEMMVTWGARRHLDLSILAHDMRDRGTADDLRRGVGYLAELVTDYCCTDPNPSHVDILRKAAAKRDLELAIEEASASMCRGTDGLAETAAKLRQRAESIEVSDEGTVHTVGDLMLMDDIGPTPYNPTGFYELDKYISGWMPGTLAIVAARPSMGKSAFGLSAALKAAKAGHGVAFVSSEMAKEQVRDRLLASQSGIEHFAIREGRVAPGDRQIQEAKELLYDLPLAIDDEARAYPMTARALVSRTRQKWGKCDLVIVDYLQRLEPDWKEKNRNREQEVATIARTLQKDARSMGVTVLALAQLGRQTQGRPKLSDLRESGGIEADADVVLMLWYADPEEFKTEVATVKCTVAKNRHGKCGEFDMTFDKARQRFE
jgi:replicative DNA helicase